MKSICLDASVAAKWFLPRANETLVDEALDLFGRYARGEIEFFVPGLFWAEFGNIAWKAARMRRWNEAAALDAVQQILKLGLHTVPDADLIDEAVSIALSMQRTVYDALYLALARLHDIEMVTADERLANAVAARFPVKWLGAL